MKHYREIILAIESFKNDIVKYPIFFCTKDLIYLESEEAIENISKKITDINYKSEFPEIFKIPYDTVSSRNAYHLSIDDLIIRYFIVNHFKKNINLFSNHVNPKDFKVYCIVDIYNCYNHIGKDVFLNTIKNDYCNKLDPSIINLLINSLNYSNQYSNKISGILIGSKPDEYFAELFLSIIHLELNNKVSENISRNGDEYLIGANSLNELKRMVSDLDCTLTKYGLHINKSKNFIKFITETRSITRVIPYEEPWPYTSPSCPPPDFPTILFKEINYNKTIGQNKSKVATPLINSYEESIEYLKFIIPETQKIELLTKRYSAFSLFGHWSSSTPNEEKKLHEAINFELVLNPLVLDNLETIIYRYPRSQYFSSQAINAVCIYAIYMDYSYTSSCQNNSTNAYIIDLYDFKSYNSKASSFLCEKANSILLNAIRSNEIYDYLKYLIIRELYFDKKNLTINKQNYKLSGEIPFPILFEKEFKKILENEYKLELPIKTIIKELIE